MMYRLISRLLRITTDSPRMTVIHFLALLVLVEEFEFYLFILIQLFAQIASQFPSQAEFALSSVHPFHQLPR